MSVCLSVYMYVGVCVCVYVCMCVYVYVCIRVCMYACMYVYINLRFMHETTNLELHNYGYHTYLYIRTYI